MVSMKYLKVEIHKLRWLIHWCIIPTQFLTIPKKLKLEASILRKIKVNDKHCKYMEAMVYKNR